MQLAARLRADARRVDERRLLLLAGDPDRTRKRALSALDAAGIDRERTRYVGRADFPAAGHDPKRADDLLGTTHEAVVLDCHDACRPNALGRVVGAVDGGGLLLLLAPALDEWPDRRDAFDDSLAAPPFDRDQVIGYFRRRLVALLRAHRGIAVVDVDSGTVERDGVIDGPPRRPRPDPEPPGDHAFPASAYAACLTQDQSDALADLERLRDPGQAVVVEADRGRGKSSAAGLAAASLALEGKSVLVTAPRYANAREVFARARELLEGRDALAGYDSEPDPHRLETTNGSVEFEKPARAAERAGTADVAVVDEAAALPVRLLERFLAAESVAFATTVHGYEGAGRGFSVRFRDRLGEGDHAVTDVRLADPIRYAPGDPIEVWAFRALGLDARPAVDPLVEDADPGTVAYRRLSSADLLDDENLLRETFGLLVLAHYRTEPNDLARLLDAPNVTARALVHGGHVVSVALLAREGDLPADLRAAMYEGERVRGNMIPDVLTSQLRDEAAGDPVGYRVLRIATHRAARSRGLGSHLLDRVREEFADGADWLGVGYGATPPLLSFWDRNGFSTVHLSTTRNDTSGEHSAVMLDPLSAAGRVLHDRHIRWFAERIGPMLTDALAELDADVVRGALRTTDAPLDPDLSPREWQVAAGIAGGATVLGANPRPPRRLALAYLSDDDAADSRLTDRRERLLVRKALQAQGWDRVADDLGYAATSECMRAFSDALASLVREFGDDDALTELERLA